MSTNCTCGHDKKDHVLPLMGMHGYGTCKVCLCERYTKVQVRDTSMAAKVSSQA
jgi:hypothetical protein